MNKIKVDFRRFVDTIPVEIDIEQGKNDIPKVQSGLQELKRDAESAKTSLSKMMDSLVPASATSNLKTMRNATKSNIANLLKEAENYIKNANASDKFKLQIKAEQDKFAVLDKSTDYRTKSTPSEVNKFTGVENRILKAMNTETAQQEKLIQNNISALKKQFDAEEKNRLAQEKMNNAVKDENKTRSQTSSLMTEFQGGINMMSQGILGISNGSKSFLKHITGVAVTFRILGGVVSGITDTFKNLYDTAASYEEAVNLYRTALGKYAEEADQWATKISTALHLDPKDVMQYTGALYNLVQGLGVGEDAAYTMATNMTQLSYDMSSFLNIDVESAYAKIQSAITGQSRAVANAGVALQQASLQELAYSMGIKKAVSEMSQAEKTYLRYIQLMRSTTDMQQDLGKTILTPENALRVLRAEFVQFARALGQVVIPIVLKVIPYLTALANMLTEVARSIAKAFGFEMTKIDYSSFDTGNDKLKSLNKNLKDTGTGAKKAGKEIQRSLAPFDELNVVESESKTGGGIGSGGGGASVLPSLEEYVTGYDMLGKLTKDFDKQVEAARANLEKMIPVIKNVAIAFGLWKLTEKIAGFVDLVSKFKLGIKEGKGLGGVIKTLATRFSEGFKYSKALGGDGLGSVLYGIRNMLGPLGTAVSTFALFTGAMVGAASITSSWNGDIDDLTNKLVGSAGLTTALTVVAGVIAGPYAAIAVALGGIGGAIIGVSKAYERMREEEEYQKAYDTLFDGQGASLQRLQYDLENTFKPLEDYNTKQKEASDATKDANEKVEQARTAIEELNATLEGSSTEENTKHIGEIKTAYDNLKTAVVEADEKEKDRQVAQLKRLLEEGQISKQEYDKRVKEITTLTNLRAAEAKGYYKELADLEAKLATGKITQEEYNKEVQKLASDYSLVAEHGNDLQLNMLGMYDVANKGFDLENPEAMKTALEKLMGQYNDLKNNTQEVYNTNHGLNQQQIEDYDLQLATMARLNKEGTAEYEALSKARNSLYETDKSLTEQYNKDMEIHGATYKDVMLTMLAQIDQAGLTSNSNVESVVSTIRSNLDSLKDYDASKSTAGIFKSFATNFEANGGQFSQKATTMFATYASEIGNKFDLNLSTGVKNAIDNSTLKMKPQVKSSFATLGDYTVDGLCEGISAPKSTTKITTATDNMSKYTISHTKDKFGVHSPSTVFMEIGEYLDQGLAKGIDDNISVVEGSLNRMNKRITDTMKNQKISLNLDDNIEKSLNNMLTKLQKFCNNWRNAINKLASGMKSTMNSIKIDKDGKVTYNSMPDIKVSKFEKGGFPKSGDFFWANENGKAEYIASIGNRSAVANQDQMVSALSGAILTAMSQIPVNSQPSNIVVNVGDKKLYEGQGEYQNRQNDRYGTTVVKI